MGRHSKPKTEAEKTAEWFDASWSKHYHNGRKARVAEKTRWWQRQGTKSRKK